MSTIACVAAGSARTRDGALPRLEIINSIPPPYLLEVQQIAPDNIESLVEEQFELNVNYVFSKEINTKNAGVSNKNYIEFRHVASRWPYLRQHFS